MSMYSEIIAEANRFDSILFAYDFLEFDTTAEVVPQSAVSDEYSNPDLVAAGVLSAMGLTMDGLQQLATHSIEPPVPNTAIFIITPGEGVASTLVTFGYSTNQNRFFQITLDSSLVPTFSNPYKSDYIVGTVPLEVGVPSIIAVRTGSSAFMKYGPIGGALTTVTGFIDGGWTMSTAATYIERNTLWLCDGFVGTVGTFIGFEGYLEESALDSLIDKFNIIGRLTLSTNLPDTRSQGVAAVSDSGNVLATSMVPEGETELTINIPVQAGESMAFVAFDPVPNLNIYRTEIIDPQGLTELAFQIRESSSTITSKVSGVVQIDGTPTKRIVRAFGYNPTVHDIDGESVNLSKSLGHATSDPDTGEYTIDLLAGYDQRIFVVAFDDYGDGFSPNMAVGVGDRVHPTTPNGYVWECVGAGTLPEDEPAWIVDTETSQLYGSASMIAVPFYRPMVHGPVTPEIIDPDPDPDPEP